MAADKRKLDNDDPDYQDLSRPKRRISNPPIPNSFEIMTRFNPNTGVAAVRKLKTGDAKGADSEFSKCARAAGHLVECVTVQSKQRPELDTALPCLREAATHLKKAVPLNGYVRDLLLRDYFQIDTPGLVLFAVSDFEPKHPIDKKPSNNVSIKGGTGWTCQLFIDKFIRSLPVETRDTTMHVIPFYFYSQTEKSWYGCSTIGGLLSWSKLTSLVQIRLLVDEEGTYAGVGARELTDDGRKAIHDLYLAVDS